MQSWAKPLTGYPHSEKKKKLIILSFSPQAAYSPGGEQAQPLWEGAAIYGSKT